MTYSGFVKTPRPTAKRKQQDIFTERFEAWREHHLMTPVQTDHASINNHRRAGDQNIHQYTRFKISTRHHFNGYGLNTGINQQRQC